MTVIAKAEKTITKHKDITAYYRYYLALTSTLGTPSIADNTVYPPTSIVSGTTYSWNDYQPAFSSMGTTKTLYFVDCTVFSDNSLQYSAVSVDSDYTASLTAYNLANNVQTQVNDLDVGARNLFRGTTMADYENIVVNNNTSDWSKYLRYYNGSASIHSFTDWTNGVYQDTITLSSASNLGISFVRVAEEIDLDPDSSYTISCWAKSSQTTYPLCIGLSYRTTSDAWVWRGGQNPQPFDAADTWQRFTFTFQPDDDVQVIDYCFTVRGTAGGTDTFSIRHCKLEKGTMATDWTPAPEDVRSEIDTANSNITALDADTDAAMYGTITYQYTHNVSGEDVAEIVYKREDGTYYYVTNDDTATEVNVDESDLDLDTNGSPLTGRANNGLSSNIAAVSNTLGEVSLKVDGIDNKLINYDDYVTQINNSLVAKKYAVFDPNAGTLVLYAKSYDTGENLSRVELTPAGLILYGEGEYTTASGETVHAEATPVAYMVNDNGVGVFKATNSQQTFITMTPQDASVKPNYQWIAQKNRHLSLKKM